MVPAPANVRRHFLPWDRPLLPQAVEFLAEGWGGDGPLDLSRQLVVVPTAQSGRRLREALAQHAAGRGRAAFPPRVLTPEVLLSSGLAATPASRLDSLLAWAGIFRRLELSDFREVFPVDPPARNFAWALRLAGEFIQLQSTLAEVGLNLRGVSAGAWAKEEDFPEAARWRQLGELERCYDEELAGRGLRDAQAAKISAAQAPAPLVDLARVVVLATPDPLPLALVALGAHARTLPVEVVVFAPPSESGAFDAWGRPLAPGWEARLLNLPDFEDGVHLCADPEAQADRIAAAARGYGNPDGRLAAGVADSEVLPPLESALARAGIVSFNPEGRLRRRDGLYQLLAALAALAREPAFSNAEALARCPDFLAFLTVRLGRDFLPARWLEGLDELHARHLPATLAGARAHAPALERFPEVGPALDTVEEMRALLTTGDFATATAAALALIFGARSLDLAREPDARLEDSAGVWTGVLTECAAAKADLAPGEWWDLALQLFGDSRRTEDRPAGALELQGWLELLWEAAPHLVVAGCNDGRVPDAVVGDPFLPEALRARLGLKTNAARFARDAYLLAALAASRARDGRLDLLVGRVSATGEPLRPSRLLFRCAGADLPRRVKFLFGPAPVAQPNPPWRRAWRLQPPPAAPLQRLRVTAFSDYLKCPFRFYLKHVLRLESVDPHKSELDAMNFGTLCHGALEDMGRAPALRDCADPAVLRAFLLDALERGARAQYGTELTLPLVIQLESARQRLARAAEIQAEQRAQGWVIQESEKKFALKIGEIEVNGKIDRIESQGGTGFRRVLDYKTSDAAATPFKAHCRRPGRGTRAAPACARFTADGTEYVWTDLQLPLYLQALVGPGPEAGRSAPPTLLGYFNLPKATGETGLALWEDYTPEVHAAATRCVEGVSAAIQAGIFWPPAEPAARDEEELFSGFFHHGTAASVDPRFYEKLGFVSAAGEGGP